ncbi:MAG: hypothetical protein ABI193_06890 [Minicystis sp.]
MRLGIIMALGLAALAITGCAKNEAASAACAASTDSSSCESCCKTNGANGYKYVGGGTCGCLGGKEGAATPAPVVGGGATSFAGTYKSTWGPTVFTQDGAKVNAKYPNGSMTCTPTGPTLDCDWREAASFGKARLTRDASGSLRGTWGNGGSATNGGSWIFNR